MIELVIPKPHALHAATALIPHDHSDRQLFVSLDEFISIGTLAQVPVLLFVYRFRDVACANHARNSFQESAVWEIVLRNSTDRLDSLCTCGT